MMRKSDKLWRQNAISLAWLLTAFACCAAEEERAALATSSPSQAILPAEAKLRDGLQLVEMVWRTIASHEVSTATFSGTIAVQAHLPANWQGDSAKKIPIAFGIEIRFVFDLKSADHQNRLASLKFALVAPPSGRKWLKPFAEIAKKQGLKYTLEDNRMAFETPLPLDEGWWLTLPVTNATAAGDYEYEISWNGIMLARGAFTFFDLPQPGRDDLQRLITVYFFSHVAYPRFKAWVEEHNGRLPNVKEFLAALDELEYFPANDYTAHRGLPKRLDQIARPEKTWLARECRPGADGRVVVVYADGSVGLDEPLAAGDDRGEQ